MYNVNGINTDPSTEACGASIITFIVKMTPHCKTSLNHHPWPPPPCLTVNMGCADMLCMVLFCPKDILVIYSDHKPKLCCYAIPPGNSSKQTILLQSLIVLWWTLSQTCWDSLSIALSDFGVLFLGFSMRHLNAPGHTCWWSINLFD